MCNELLNANPSKQLQLITSKQWKEVRARMFQIKN